MMKNRWITLIVCLLVALGAGSCRKLLDAPPPSNTIPAGAVFANDDAAQTALVGFYIQAMDNTGGILNGNTSLYAGLSADELVCFNPRLNEDSFYVNQLTAANRLSTNLFSSAYTLIYSLNSLITGVNQSKGMTPGGRAELQGEAKFLRSLLYFYLVNLYGGVPVVTGVDYTVNATLPRAAVDSVYRQMVSDLLDAQQSLPVDYVATYAYRGDRTRPVQAAATALLARVWLYEGQWARAEQAAGVLVGDPRYRLGALDSVFLASSQEAIWQLQPVHDSMATADAGYFLPVPIPPRNILVAKYPLTATLLSSIDSGDLRRAHWTASVSLGPKTYVYPFKYKVSTNRPGDAEYEMVLRLAEQYLIRAEARAQQGNLAGALADLDIIRARAGLAPSTATDVNSILAAIQAERRVELMTEWGHRWLDLQRTGQSNAVLGVKPGWKPTDVLYPIPADELSNNPAINQNPGY